MGSEKKFSVRWKDGEQPIPLYYIENIKPNTDTLVVYLHGAAGKPLFPYYNGRGISKRVDGASFLLFSDPIRSLDPKLEATIGWYCSPYPEEEIISSMTRIVSETKEKYNFKTIMLIGGSAAGIAIVRMMKELSGASCFIWNPQTNLLDYYSGHVKRWKAITRYSKESNHTNILDESLYREDNKYYIAQKVDDQFHKTIHFQPLKELIKAKPNVYLCIGNWDKRQGHIAPSGDKQIELLKSFVTHGVLSKTFLTRLLVCKE